MSGQDRDGADRDGQAPGARTIGARTRTIRRKGGTSAPESTRPPAPAAPRAEGLRAAQPEVPPDTPSPAATPAEGAQASATPEAEAPARLANEPGEASSGRAGRLSERQVDGEALLAELEDLDEATMARLLGMGSPTLPEPGQKIRGTVVRASGEVIMVDVGAKSEAWLERSELAEDEDPAVGDTLEAYVVSADTAGIRLARRLAGAAAQDALEDAYEAGLPVEGKVVSRSGGGFSVRFGGARAFCPVSHIDLHPDPDLDSYVGRTLSFEVLELGERDVVVSHKRVAARLAEEAGAQLWTELAVGDTRDGVVTGVKPFGVFVDLGGVQGLVPTRELGWESDTEAPTRGTRVRVRVIDLDPEARKVTLSLRDPALGPWARVGTELKVGDVVSGKVVRLADFGAFVELSGGIQGLVHLSNLADRRVGHPSEVVQVGRQVQVRILSVDRERERMDLGLRQATEEDWVPTGASASQDSSRGGKRESGGFGTMADLFAGITLKKD